MSVLAQAYATLGLNPYTHHKLHEVQHAYSLAQQRNTYGRDSLSRFASLRRAYEEITHDRSKSEFTSKTIRAKKEVGSANSEIGTAERSGEEVTVDIRDGHSGDGANNDRTERPVDEIDEHQAGEPEESPSSSNGYHNNTYPKLIELLTALDKVQISQQDSLRVFRIHLQHKLDREGLSMPKRRSRLRGTDSHEDVTPLIDDINYNLDEIGSVIDLFRVQLAKVRFEMDAAIANAASEPASRAGVPEADGDCDCTDENEREGNGHGEGLDDLLQKWINQFPSFERELRKWTFILHHSANPLFRFVSDEDHEYAFDTARTGAGSRWCGLSRMTLVMRRILEAVLRDAGDEMFEERMRDGNVTGGGEEGEYYDWYVPFKGWFKHIGHWDDDGYGMPLRAGGNGSRSEIRREERKEKERGCVVM